MTCQNRKYGIDTIILSEAFEDLFAVALCSLLDIGVSEIIISISIIIGSFETNYPYNINVDLYK